MVVLDGSEAGDGKRRAGMIAQEQHALGRVAGMAVGVARKMGDRTARQGLEHCGAGRRARGSAEHFTPGCARAGEDDVVCQHSAHVGGLSGDVGQCPALG